VVAAVLALVGVASCSSSASPARQQAPVLPVAAVTGFVSASGVAASEPSGPVTVSVTGIEASRLAQLVSRLPTVPQSQVDCMEPLGLIYRIVFGAGVVARSKTVVEGYQCDAAVTVAVAGKVSSWRRDATCNLMQFVRQVLPARAKATQTLAIGCGT
jgi:hypothetical protein